eukprot:TRINITY_DN21090_c0_g1_i5.p1 TRINITY_DN21090_c0_g1~~TRINITY_DN21090_c0_g1_i5.p1  ORF type:complete len:509 (-),score=85.76 TRINITY_DN21090_c0_g1_i5:297-1823(-)
MSSACPSFAPAEVGDQCVAWDVEGNCAPGLSDAAFSTCSRYPFSRLDVEVEAPKRRLTALNVVLLSGLVLAMPAFAPHMSRLHAEAASRALAAEEPMWGCGLLGKLPGITTDGETTPETQRLIDALKRSSSFGKVSYWNWNLAPGTPLLGEPEFLSKDFLFMPEQWGAGAVNPAWVRPAGESPFIDSNGQSSPAEMSTLFLGMNEPDIQGSCMGDMFGKCVRPCDDVAVAAGDCPAASLNASSPEAAANTQGMCNCWEHSQSTGVGFWPLQGCTSLQPLPSLWEQEPACIDMVMSEWRKTAETAWSKGYKYLSTPLLAVDIAYAEKFVQRACQCSAPGQCACTEASCGCPAYVGLHYYAFDCRPNSTGGYRILEERLDGIARLMEKYHFIKGAILNEVGMLDCPPSSEAPICVPGAGQFPAQSVPDHGCPSTPELPNGLASFITQILEIVRRAATTDGQPVVKGFSWFNQDRAGGTYNLRLFDEDGSVNAVGEAYMEACQAWGEATLQ